MEIAAATETAERRPPAVPAAPTPTRTEGMDPFAAEAGSESERKLRHLAGTTTRVPPGASPDRRSIKRQPRQI